MFRRQHALAIEDLAKTLGEGCPAASFQASGQPGSGRSRSQGPGQLSSQKLMDQGLVLQRLRIDFRRQARQEPIQRRPILRCKDLSP